jgi:hypothetical protein
MRRLVVLTMLSLLAIAAPAAAQEPVMGIEGLYQFGSGWGEARPETLYNGGVPSGNASGITWRDWGADVAFGRGKIPQYRPGGGYYRRRVAIEFQASRLGECADARGTPAYTRLIFRARVRPGGPFGDWTPWTYDLCDFESRPSACPRVSFGNGRGARRVAQWDTDCATAAAVARDSQRVRYRRGFAKYRYTFDGFVCNGYSFSGERKRITFTCSRDTAVVEFTRV